MNCLLFLFVLFLSVVFSYGDNVTYVAVVVRNGERTPLPSSIFPMSDNEPHGRLTPTGRINSFYLGMWLVEKYKHLFENEDLKPYQIYIKSVDSERAVVTAKEILLGMLSPDTVVKNKMYMRYKIKIHVIGLKQDHIFGGLFCDEYEEELKSFMDTEDHRSLLQSYDEIMAYLSSIFRQQITSFEDIKIIFKNLHIQQLNNTLPHWAKEIYPDMLLGAAAYAYCIPTFTEKMARLKVGPLLKDIIIEMNKYSFVGSGTKMSIFSGHSETIANVLHGLRIYNIPYPDFLATILFELSYENVTQSYNVRILYKRNSYQHTPELMFIPKCGYSCPLNKFILLTEPVLPQNWLFECESKYVLLKQTFWLWLAIVTQILIIVVTVKIIFILINYFNGLGINLRFAFYGLY